MTDPTLNINIIDTNTLTSLLIVDSSNYPQNFNPTNGNITVTPPGYDIISVAFSPKQSTLYDSKSLGIVCSYCENVNLPDGLWKIKFSISPAYRYYIERTYAKVDLIEMKFDKAFLSLKLIECSTPTSAKDQQALNQIEVYIKAAKAAGNNCHDSLFQGLYDKANKLLDNFLNSKTCVKQ